MIAQRSSRTTAWLLGAVILAGATTAAWAQDAAAPAPDQPSLEEMWHDFVQFVRIAQPKGALGTARGIIARKDDPDARKALYLLSIGMQDAPGLDAQGILRQAENLDDTLVEPARTMRTMIEQGYEVLRRDPDRIAEAIAMLARHERAARIGAERLTMSGQYAVPQLLQAVRAQDNSDLARGRIAALLPEMGRPVIRPLAVALQTRDADLLEVLAGALTKTPYPHAAPRLREALAREGLLDRTRAVLRRALRACGGEEALQLSPAEVFLRTAERYYYQRESLLPDARLDAANVWYWRNDRLEFTPVPRPIFCYVYAMRYTRLALEHDPGLERAVGLWVAAYFQRELHLPDGAKDPLAPAHRARYYALASGAGYLQDVLQRALRDGQTQMALRGIQELARTAGAHSLAHSGAAGEIGPLLAALHYPDRRVRLLAALSLANALPAGPFDGAERVMYTLKTALGLTGGQTAVVAVTDDEARNRVVAALRAAGYEVLVGAEPRRVLRQARAGQGLDLLVIGSARQDLSMLRAVRKDVLLSMPPAIVLGGTPEARSVAEDDRLSRLHDPADDDDQAIVAAAAKAVTLGGSEPMDPAEAVDWAVRAARALRRLALSGTTAYDVSQALPALAQATRHESPKLRTAAAEALAMLAAPQAQQAVAALALDAAAAEQVRLAAYDALSDSARRFGSHVTDAQAGRIVDVVTGGDSRALREAAAEALGALDLASDKIKTLITSAAGD